MTRAELEQIASQLKAGAPIRVVNKVCVSIPTRGSFGPRLGLFDKVSGNYLYYRTGDGLIAQDHFQKIERIEIL